MNQKLLLWSLVFWPETCEISVISVADIAQIVKIKDIWTGWQGDLPWVDEENRTTIYEAKLLKISKYKEALESVNVNDRGEIIKRTVPDNVMEEMKKRSAHKKNRKVIQKDSNKKLNTAVFDLPFVGTTANTENKTINKITDNRSEQYKKAEIQKDRTPSQSCTNCANCICKSWRSLLTSGNVGLFEEIAYSLKMATMKTSPMANLKEMIELYPGTNIRATKENIMLAVTRAKGNPRAMIRNLLLTIMTKEEMLKYKTGETLYKKKTTEFLAISEYLKMNENVIISDSLFINVVNKQLWEWRNKAKLTEEELEKLRKEKCEKSRQHRSKKKKIQNNKQPSHHLKKINKTASNKPSSEVRQTEHQIPSVSSPISSYSTSRSPSPLPSPSPLTPENSSTTQAPTINYSQLVHTSTPPLCNSTSPSCTSTVSSSPATLSSYTATPSSSPMATLPSAATSSSSTATSLSSPMVPSSATTTSSSYPNHSMNSYYLPSIPSYNNNLSYNNSYPSYPSTHQPPAFQQPYPPHSNYHSYSNHYYPHLQYNNFNTNNTSNY